MSETLRQNRLFAGQDWQVIYQAFNFINFSAYDYDTVRQALVDYLRVNYPEDFNDWIESSEFVAIIEMLAYLAGSLAFRMDLNVRENFMDTATRRESVFRLARYLSYTPRRCLTSQGLVKLQSVRTSQPIFDSNGKNLSNQLVLWNDANNPDWLEQFVLVLNAAFVNTNPFGDPVKSTQIGTVLAERYDLNNTNTSTLSYAFNSTVSGTAMQFEFCNSDFDTESTLSTLTGNFSGYYKEKTPNVFNNWSMLYRNDGNGNASANTGFFVLFKQGILAYADFILDSAIPNRVIDLTAINVNQSDVWVQSVTDTGIPTLDWTKVPAIFASNLVYNNVNRLTRDIYQVVTRDLNGQDAISIRFGDGNFGNIPTGRIRVYYRTSNNLTYTIQPQDIQGQALTLGYVDTTNNTYSLNLTFGLTYPVANSLSRETTDSIRARAPAVFYTQNRMVNGEDYNLFPLQNSQALKLRAVNRVYSGQSRYLELTDPTGEYSNTKVFSDDGIMYKDYTSQTINIPLAGNLNTNQIIQNRIQPLLAGTKQGQAINPGLRNFYLSEFPKFNVNTTWKVTGGSVPNASQGEFVNVFLPDLSKGLTTGSLVAFGNPGETQAQVPYGNWAAIVNESTDQLGVFSVLLSKSVITGSPAWVSIPPLRVSLTDAETSALTTALNSRKNFGMRYDQSTLTWKIIDNVDLAIDADFSLDNQGDTTQANLDASWLLQFLFKANQGWVVTMRSLSYMFESVSDVKFYFVNSTPVVDALTLTSQRDQIRILRYNKDINDSALPEDQRWLLQSQTQYTDGYQEPNQVQLQFYDNNQDNIIDDPEAFDKLVSSTQLVFWQKIIESGYQYWKPTQIKATYNLLNQVPSATAQSTINTYKNADVIYVINANVFLKYKAQAPQAWLDVSTEYKARTGRNSINYCWQHYASRERRIDPAVQNVIDMYVLTSSYDTNMRNWITKGRPQDPEPMPPYPEDLRQTFQEFNKYKMMTDQMIWHPVKYKLLFGDQAMPELRCIFKVIKISGSSITDSEIKSRVIQAVDTYFDIANWSFGQSFYFTELVAFIHQQMATLVSTVVIVPTNGTSQFGDLFEISCAPDELFLSAARVTDVQVVANLTPAELRMDR
jgi:hypothetical protein